MGSRGKLDLLCMELLLEDGLFEITELESHATRPVGYVYQLGVTPYISKEYAPVEERIKAVNRHLANIPTFLSQAEENLNRTLAEPFVKISRMMLQGTIQELTKDASMKPAKPSFPQRDKSENLREVPRKVTTTFLPPLK